MAQATPAESNPGPLEKIERLGCLYLTFLNNPGGLSFQQIKGYLPLAYQGDQESSRRKFERDKEELKRLGLALRHFAPGETLPSGAPAPEHRYVPMEEIQRLPELRLSAEEASELAAVLFAAMDEYGTRDPELVENLKSAAMKLLYRHPASRAPEPAPGERPRVAQNLLAGGEERAALRLGEVMDALHRRRVLALTYPAREGGAVERRVEGRGLLTHRGRWCLVAYCRKVQAIRSFYLDRMQSLEVLAETYRPDPDFRIKDYSLHPLGLRMHPVEELRLLLDEEREEIFRDFLIGLPAYLNATTAADGELRLQTSNRAALFSWMTRNPGVVRALGPEAARSAFRAYLAAMDEPRRVIFDREPV